MERPKSKSVREAVYAFLAGLSGYAQIGFTESHLKAHWEEEAIPREGTSLDRAAKNRCEGTCRMLAQVVVKLTAEEERLRAEYTLSRRVAVKCDSDMKAYYQEFARLLSDKVDAFSAAAEYFRCYADLKVVELKSGDADV